jgi:hypothetical protein
MGFDSASGIKLDGRRAYRGVPQVTKLENQLLSRIAKSGLWLSFVKGAAVYGIGRKKLEARDRMRAQRLIEHGYLVPHSRGLFADGPDQTWTVRPQTDPPLPGDRSVSVLTKRPKESKLWPPEEVMTRHPKSTLAEAMEPHLHRKE